jgi:uncharacterized membrane protein
VLAGLFLHEGFPRSLVTGLAIAFAGVATIAIATSTGRRDGAGVLLALGAAGLYAVGVLLQKQALRDVDPFTATWLGCTAGAVVCLPFLPALGHEIVRAPWTATAGIVYMGLFPTAIAFATWSYALAHTTAGRLSSSSYLVPMLAVLLSWLLLGEVPVPLALVGGALCLVGVAVARIPSRKPAPLLRLFLRRPGHRWTRLQDEQEDGGGRDGDHRSHREAHADLAPAPAPVHHRRRHRAQHDREVAAGPDHHEPGPRVLGLAAAGDQGEDEDRQVCAEHGQERAHPLAGPDLIGTGARHPSTVLNRAAHRPLRRRGRWVGVGRRLAGRRTP